MNVRALGSLVQMIHHHLPHSLLPQLLERQAEKHWLPSGAVVPESDARRFPHSLAGLITNEGDYNGGIERFPLARTDELSAMSKVIVVR